MIFRVLYIVLQNISVSLIRLVEILCLNRRFSSGDPLIILDTISPVRRRE